MPAPPMGPPIGGAGFSRQEILGVTSMTIRTPSLARAQGESGVSKLTLISVCIIFMTAAIAKQMPAHATDAIAVVSLADLDLSTEKGMQTAHERLDATARRLCKE